MAKRPENATATRSSYESEGPAGNAGIVHEDRPVSSRRLAKSADPAFMKFTTYIKKATHLGVKTRLVSKEKELSDLVEDLLSNWLKENESIHT
jgi:hypothetical protein